MEDRSWAAGLNQEEFNAEWTKRFPKMDIIPDVTTWVKPLPTQNKPRPDVTNWIDPFNPEMLESEQPVVNVIDKEKNEKIKKEKQGHLKAFYNCKYCNAPKKGKVGVTSHERHCKHKPKVDLDSPKEKEKELNTEKTMQCQYCNKFLNGKLNLMKHERRCVYNMNSTQNGEINLSSANK